MKKKTIILLTALLSVFSSANAQWAVFDPSNFAQSIVNSANEIVQTSSTANNMIQNFQETVKIYEQGKRYYDALKSVHDLVKSARKVQQTILLVGDISDIYVNNFNRMMGDKNFTVEELTAIAFGYNRLLQESSDLLLDLKEVTTSTGLSMTDKERLEIIDKIYCSVSDYKNLTWYYTRKNIGVSYLRSKKSGDSARVLALYGSQSERYW
jgi:predicted RND superfamily exporter protein